MNNEDKEAQEDEMIALESILDPGEFSIHPGETKSGQIQISLALPTDFCLQINKTAQVKDSGGESERTVKLSHLPPLTLHFTLPADYPSQTKPSFTLSSSWLDRSSLSILCKKLDENWETNSGMAILFTWYSVLKEETLKILGITDTYDISWWYTTGPNAKSVSSAASSQEGCSNGNLLKPRVRTRSGSSKPSSSQDMGSKKLPLLDALSLQNEKCSPIPSTSSMPKDSAAEMPQLQPHLQLPSSSRDICISELRKHHKRGSNGDAVRSDDHSDGVQAKIENLSRSCSSSIDKDHHHHHHHHVKHGKMLDPRAVFDWQSFSSICDYLTNFNIEKTEEEFKSTSQTCDICYNEKYGTECIRFQCSHIFCKDCVKQFFSEHITRGSVESVRCPGYDCKVTPTHDQVRELVDEELFERYDRLLLTRSLESMSDVTFCPISKCLYPAVRDPVEKIARCSACQYVFCPDCRMVYHGVEPCRFKTSEKKEVYEKYTAGTESEKKEMEKIYGKKQLSLLVDAAMSEAWVNEKSKPCPHCASPIEKFEGCNKVACFKCNTYFCWLCGVQLRKENPYFHFNDPTSKCFNTLFQGVNVDGDLVLDDDEDESDVDEDAFLSDESDYEMELALRFVGQ